MIALPLSSNAWFPPDRGALRLASCAIVAGIASFVAASTLLTITSPAVAGGEGVRTLAAAPPSATDGGGCRVP